MPGVRDKSHRTGKLHEGYWQQTIIEKLTLSRSGIFHSDYDPKHTFIENGKLLSNRPPDSLNYFPPP
ncbi:hypothetical protein TNCV_4414431 [Trichonephila clavipes]|uniref:Uncharacterized protein n=1 Tax=Trichonephila clavipes TaxID=2585209 RepID=A0A8X6VFP4_TRICX|nr:hypothetical protein TNCV_4414431 [Trichonephila clavipes]